MERRVFDEICDAIIRPLGDDLASRTFESQAGEHVLTFAGEWCSILHEHYERWRWHAHGIMRDPEMLIDRHKIVACLMLAILEAGPLQATAVKAGGNFQPIVRICNEVLAFQAGMQVLTRFTLEDELEKGSQDLCERLLEPMSYPLSTVKDESYLDQMYRALYHLRLQLQRQRSPAESDGAGSQQRHARFSADQFLLLANLVFMLEQYNLHVKSYGQS